MKVNEKKKICNKISIIILFTLFISFLSIYLSAESGYYEFEQHNKMILTDEKIKEFEQDVKDRKEIDIKEYVVSNVPNYENNVSKLGSLISTYLEDFVQNGLEKIFKFFNKLLQG